MSTCSVLSRSPSNVVLVWSGWDDHCGWLHTTVVFISTSQTFDQNCHHVITRPKCQPTYFQRGKVSWLTRCQENTNVTLLYDCLYDGPIMERFRPSVSVHPVWIHKCAVETLRNFIYGGNIVAHACNCHPHFWKRRIIHMGYCAAHIIIGDALLLKEVCNKVVHSGL